MLNIAVIGRTYIDAKNFINLKFKDKISFVNSTLSQWTLKNGDIIHICYSDPAMYTSMNYDAYIVTSSYESLESVIKYRVSRP